MMVKLLAVMFVAGFAVGCASYPAELLVEQTALLQRAADQSRAVAVNVEAEYVAPAIAADDASRRGAYLGDMDEVARRYVAGEVTLEGYVAEAERLKGLLDADKAGDDASRRRPLVALETNAVALEGSIESLRRAVGKINDDEVTR